MEIVFATNNPNKLKEVQAGLPDAIRLLTLRDIGCEEEIPETAPTIAGNARQKADYIKERYGYDCFADDTGLEVAALDGAPGVLSARYAGLQKSAADNMAKLLTELAGKTHRTARFVTVIALRVGAETYLFEGRCPGQITEQKQGADGFGYDPIFRPEGFDRTFSEMTLAQKNEIGHRGKAVRQLLAFLNER